MVAGHGRPGNQRLDVERTDPCQEAQPQLRRASQDRAELTRSGPGEHVPRIGIDEGGDVVLELQGGELAGVEPGGNRFECPHSLIVKRRRLRPTNPLRVEEGREVGDIPSHRVQRLPELGRGKSGVDGRQVPPGQ